MSSCRSCDAPIKWAITAAKGRRIPLDPSPVEGGNIRLEDDPDPRRGPVAHVVPEAERDRPLYVSHFTTCPNREKHRRRRHA